jgi:large subunit ribosomal protein L13
MRTTFQAKPKTVEQEWWHFDADGVVLGRLAVRVATLLMGKHKPTYTRHVDTGDFVVITNAEKVKVTGRKAEQKVYRHHTGYVGNLRELPYARVLEENPTAIIELAVRRMLPKNRLGRKMFKKLKVYAGGEHPHAAQSPKPATL